MEVLALLPLSSGRDIPIYLFMDTSGQTTATGTRLLAETYTVNVTDNNGCTASNYVNYPAHITNSNYGYNKKCSLLTEVITEQLWLQP